MKILASISTVTVLVLALGCGRSSETSRLTEAWSPSNSPALLSGSGVKSTFAELPLQGTVAQRGWSDSYWPTYMGGISYRWQTGEKNYPLIEEETSETVFATQSPAEKYDLTLGRFDFPTVADERLRTGILKTIEGTSEYDREHEIPLWEGLCHGWAPAAQNFKEPVKTLRVPLAQGRQVIFYPSDIKALLIYYQQYAGNRSTRTVFAGERCNADFKKLQEKVAKREMTVEEFDAVRNSPACRDLNPGTLHLALTNEVGLGQKGFIVDMTRDAEVWNQPVNSYESSVLRVQDGASEGAAAGTQKEVTVETRMAYTVEIQATRAVGGVMEKTAVYQYVLELDEKGAIIGGRWLTEDRPDFLWRESAPIFQGYFKRLELLYRQSIAP